MLLQFRLAVGTNYAIELKRPDVVGNVHDQHTRARTGGVILSQAASTFSYRPNCGSRMAPASHNTRAVSPRAKAFKYIDGMIAVLIITAAAACVSFYLRTRSELDWAQAKRAAQARKLEKLQVETERVANEIERLKYDAGFIESVARQSLGMIRPGDVVIRLDDRVDQGLKPARLTSTKPSAYTDGSN